MEDDVCFACVSCDFMTYSSANLVHHFRVRHFGIPPTSVFKQISDPMSAVIRQTDMLLYNSRQFSSQTPLQICPEESAITSKVKTERTEILSSSPKSVLDFRADLSDQELKPYPMKLFNSFPIDESHSAPPHHKRNPNKIKEEIPEVTLVSSELDLKISGHEDLEVDTAGKPLSLLSVDAILSAKTKIEDGENQMEVSDIHREMGSNNGQTHLHSDINNNPQIAQYSLKSVSNTAKDNFLPSSSSSIVPLPRPCTENRDKDSTSRPGICEQILQTSVSLRAEQQYCVKNDVFMDPQKVESISVKVNDSSPQPATTLEMSQALPTAKVPTIPAGQNERLVNSSRVTLSFEQKLKIMEKLESMGYANFAQTARDHGVSRSQISRLWKNRDVLRTYGKEIHDRSRKRKCPFKGEDVDRALKVWLEEKSKQNVHINDRLLKEKAEQLATEMGHSFSLSGGWLCRFKKRHGLSFKRNLGNKK